MQEKKATTVPVPQYMFWTDVMIEVNKALHETYKDQGYIQMVYQRVKHNSRVEKALPKAIEKVNRAYARRGMRSKYSIDPIFTGSVSVA